MKINGMGKVNKKDILAIFNEEIEKALKDGRLTWEEVAETYKYEMARRASKIRYEFDIFKELSWKIPRVIYDKLSPEEIASMVDILYDASQKQEVCVQAVTESGEVVHTVLILPKEYTMAQLFSIAREKGYTKIKIAGAMKNFIEIKE